jgi:hypothetical protein
VSGKLYEQQPFDTQLSWIAFQDYLKMEKPRTLESLHKAYVEAKSKTTQSLSTLKNWYAAKGWKERAAAFDKEQADITIQKMAERQQQEDLERVVDFAGIAARSGKAGVIVAGNLKKAIAEFIKSDFKIRTLDEAYKAARIIQAIEPSSLEMLAQSIGVTKLLDSVEVN